MKTTNSCKMIYDRTGAADDLMGAIQGEMAHFYSANLSRRIRRGIAAKKKLKKGSPKN